MNDPVYFFASTFYFSLFFLISAIVQCYINPTLEPDAETLSQMAAMVLIGEIGWTILIMLLIVTKGLIIRVPKLNVPVDWVFAKPIISHILTISVVCCTEYAKYGDDPREALIVTSLVCLVSSGIFLCRSAADGGAGTAKVISTAAFVSASSCFTTPSFPVEGFKKQLDFLFLVCTGVLGLAYLFISPEAPLVRVVVADGSGTLPLASEDHTRPKKGGRSEPSKMH